MGRKWEKTRWEKKKSEIKKKISDGEKKIEKKKASEIKCWSSYVNNPIYYLC